MAQRELQSMSQDEFLDWQRQQDRLFELVGGHIVEPLKMMTGTTRRHDRIVVNAIALFARELAGGPCRPWTDGVAIAIPGGNVRRPDVSVDCGELDDRELLAAEPRLVMEVLSPSTMNFDRIVKLGEYKRVESIETILLLDTQEPQLTAHMRDGQGWQEKLWQGLEASFRPAGLNMDICLRELYAGVEFEAKG